MNDQFAVVVRDLTKRFGPRLVLDNLSLRIEPGETVALIGPSGSGKSTLLRCINGLNTFERGEIEVGPCRLTPGRHSPAQLRHVRELFGMIFQDFQLFPHLTVLENVVEAPLHVLRLPKHLARDRAMNLLDRVGLWDYKDAYPRELSGGQKQRVAIARAMAMQPRGLLCDEITSALDPELKREVLSVLEDLRREGLTLVLVTHEIGFARRAADRIVMLSEGRILDDGPPHQVLEQPANPRTRQFLGQVLI